MKTTSSQIETKLREEKRAMKKIEKLILSKEESKCLNNIRKWLNGKTIVDYTGFCKMGNGDYSNSLKKFINEYMIHSCHFINQEDTVAWLAFYIRLFSSKRFYEIGVIGESCQEDAAIMDEIYYLLLDIRNRLNEETV